MTYLLHRSRKTPLETLGFPGPKRFKADPPPVYAPTFVPRRIELKPGESIVQAARRYAGKNPSSYQCRDTSEATYAELFVKGIYNAPITWWIGYINTLALTGMFGDGRNREAARYHNDVSGFMVLLANSHEARDIATRVFAHQIKSNPAGLVGRLLGMGLLAYASYGAWWGSAYFSLPSKLAIGAANTVVATYGAAIWAASLGIHRDIDKMALMLITGNANAVQCLPSLEDVNPDMRRFGKYDALDGAKGLTVATAAFAQHGYSVFR